MKLILVLMLFLIINSQAETMPKSFSGTLYVIINNEGQTESLWGVEKLKKAMKGNITNIETVCTYINGKQEGPKVGYFNYSKGLISSFQNYKAGKKHGKSIHYWSDGKNYAEGTFKNGKKWSGTFPIYMMTIGDDGRSTTFNGVTLQTFKDGKEIETPEKKTP